jgi:hypothetical protein
MSKKSFYTLILSIIPFLSCNQQSLMMHETSDSSSCLSKNYSFSDKNVVAKADYHQSVKSDTISMIESSYNRSSSSRICGIYHRITVTPFEKLSTEEKTAVFLEFLEYGCDRICYPIYAFSEQSMNSNKRKLAQIKNGLEELLQDHHLSQSGTYFESNKVNSLLLICYKYETTIQSIKLTNNRSFLSESIQDNIDIFNIEIEKKFESLQEEITTLEDKIEKESSLLLLNQSSLLDSKLLVKKIKKYIGKYYNATIIRKGSFKDILMKEEIESFCSKIVQYQTYEEFKEYLQYLTNMMDDFSDTIHHYPNKMRFLDKLKYFILSINPEINRQSENLSKLEAELCRLRRDMQKYSYFFLIEPINIALAEGYLENFLLEDLDLSTQDIKKDKAIEKVYMLVYASDDICNACTNAIPKVKSLISEKFHQQCVTVDPSDVDVLYLPISEKKEISLNKLIMKRIK